MKKNKLSELTTEELGRQKGLLKGIVIGTAIVMLVLCSLLVYLVNRSQNFGLMAMVPACMVVILPGIIRLSQVNTELKLRKAKSV